MRAAAGTAPPQVLYKNAVAGGLNGGMLPHMLQQQRQATHSPDENRAPIFASNVSLTGPGARRPIVLIATFLLVCLAMIGFYLQR